MSLNVSAQLTVSTQSGLRREDLGSRPMPREQLVANQRELAEALLSLGEMDWSQFAGATIVPGVQVATLEIVTTGDGFRHENTSRYFFGTAGRPSPDAFPVLRKLLSEKFQALGFSAY